MTTGRIDATTTHRISDADIGTETPKPLGEAAADDVRAFESALRRIGEDGEEGARNGQACQSEESDTSRSLLNAKEPERASTSNPSSALDANDASDPADPATLSLRSFRNGEKETAIPTPEANEKGPTSESAKKGEKTALASDAPDSPDASDASDAEKFLASLFRQVAPQPGAAGSPDALSLLNAQAPDEAAGVSAPQKLDTARLEAIADQILVSSREAGSSGAEEVRIRIREGVLPDTEIRLIRDVSGRLVVHVATGDAQTFQTLVAARNDLADALSATEPKGVAVFVDRNDRSGADDDASGRRSRGLENDDESQYTDVARPRSLR